MLAVNALTYRLPDEARAKLSRLTKAQLIDHIEQQRDRIKRDTDTTANQRATIADLTAKVAELQAAQDHVVYRSPLYRAVEALAEVDYRRARVESVDPGRFSPSLVIELPDASAGDVIDVMPGHEYVLISAPSADFDALSQAWCNVEPPEKGAY